MRVIFFFLAIVLLECHLLQVSRYLDFPCTLRIKASFLFRNGWCLIIVRAIYSYIQRLHLQYFLTRVNMCFFYLKDYPNVTFGYFVTNLKVQISTKRLVLKNMEMKESSSYSEKLSSIIILNPNNSKFLRCA